MEKVSAQLIGASEDMLQQMVEHPFLRETAAGTIPDESFIRWLIQDYLWLLEYQRALGILCARAPSEVGRMFHGALLNLQGEIEVFEEIAAREGLMLGGSRMILACHAYTNFLMATAGFKTFAEGISALYGADISYLRSWNWVKHHQSRRGRWQEFIDLYCGEGYGEWVKALGLMIDNLPISSPTALIDRMKESFRTTIRYEIYFWDAIYRNQDW